MQLIKNPSYELFFNLTTSSNNNILLCAPYIKTNIISKILKTKKESATLTLITTSNLGSFISKGSDIGAIKLLLENNIRVYNYQNLHAKCYIFDDEKAIVTSSNLTYSGLVKNYEYGCLINDLDTIKEITNDYEEMLKSDACGEFNQDTIKSIESIIKHAKDTVITTDEALDNIVVVNAKTFDKLSGWQKVVVEIINRINKIEFTRDEVKQYENYLKELYPNSKTPMQTVSRILQDLRDMGLLKFYGNGRYKKLWENSDAQRNEK